MNFFKRLSDWLGLSPPKTKPEYLAVREIIEIGRIARYDEDYDRALDQFHRAEKIAQLQQDTTSLAVVRLNIADTYIQMNRYDDAEDLLHDLKIDCEKAKHYTPLAYTLSLTGSLKQVRGDWAAARELYNEAISVANLSNAIGAIGRAKGRLADTYLHEGNASYAEHLLKDSLPLLDQSGDMELTSYFIGKYALTLIELGKDTDGDRLLETALQRAERMKFKQEMRRWHRIIGDRKLEKHHYASAYKHYQEYMGLSPDPLPPTTENGLMLSNLSEIARQLGQQQDALGYALRAEKILSKMDSDSLSAQAMVSIGLALRANQQYDDALGYFKRALDAIDPADTSARIKTQVELAQTHFANHAFKQAQTAYLELLEQTGDEIYETERAEVHSGLGMTYASQNHLEEATQQWMNALRIYENQSNHNAVARLYCDIAEAHYRLGDGKRAMSEYERALMLLNSVNQETRGIVLANTAISYADKGDVPTTEAFFTEAIDIARELENPVAEALRRNNYAYFLIDLGQAQRAIVSLEHAQKVITDKDKPLYQAIFSDNIGLAYQQLGKPEKALEQFNSALTRYDKLDNTNWYQLNMIYRTQVLLDLDRIEEAVTTFTALKSDDIDVQIQYGMVRSALFLHQGKLAEALTSIEQTVTHAQQTFRQRLHAKSLILQSKIQAYAGENDTANKTWELAQKRLNMLQMPVPNPNWLHVPSDL